LYGSVRYHLQAAGTPTSKPLMRRPEMNRRRSHRAVRRRWPQAILSAEDQLTRKAVDEYSLP
jgi:hypothetical protein